MAVYNRSENVWTVGLLNLQPGDRLLEVGCGPGVALQAAARSAALSVGLDHSTAMLGQARRRNHRALIAGRVRLVAADAARLPFAGGSFERLLSVNAVYFWPQPLAALGEMYRVLRPGGLLALTVRRRRGGVYDQFRPEALAELLTAAGFVDPYVVDGPDPRHPVACVMARAPITGRTACEAGR
jgi:ubiquinone/menaquinone biosynthesis C-methylase UbiE